MVIETNNTEKYLTEIISMYLSRVFLTVISYVTEDIDIVKNALLQCLPDNLRDTKIKRQNLQSQFSDKLVILSISITKKSHVKKVLSYFAEMIENKEYIVENFYDMLDLNSKSLHIRFDKFKVIDNIMELTVGSDVIKCQIGYTSYKQHENMDDLIIQLFRDARLLE